MKQRRFRRTDSGRLVEFRPTIAKPIITDTSQFVRDLFLAWKKLHKKRQEENLSHAAIGALFYETLYELFDPRHRNAFLEMLEKERKTTTYKKRTE